MSWLTTWLEGITYVRLIVTYVILSIIILVLGWFAFFFPVNQIYSMLNIEFSNLGPIATFSWGVTFVMFIVTPIFVLTLLLKLFQQ